MQIAVKKKKCRNAFEIKTNQHFLHSIALVGVTGFEPMKNAVIIGKTSLSTTKILKNIFFSKNFQKPNMKLKIKKTEHFPKIFMKS